MVIATGFDGRTHLSTSPQGRMEYNRNMFYQVASSSTTLQPAAGLPMQPAPVPVMQEQMRRTVNVGRIDVLEEDFDMDNDSGEVLEPVIEHTRLPVPEPEAQPSQRPASDPRPQRPIRRMDPKALDLPTGNRNAPPGDVIDIPAFLRKR